MRCSAVLLAGGKSSRMGRDKAQLEIGGELLWQRQLRILRSLTIAEIFLTGDLRECDCLTIADETADAGPLGGIAAALQQMSGSHLLALAVDLPRMTTAFLARLSEHCSLGRGVVPRRADRFEPLAAIHPHESLDLALHALRARDFSLQHFVSAALHAQLLRVHEISPEEAPLFANLNTPADLAAL